MKPNDTALDPVLVEQAAAELVARARRVASARDELRAAVRGLHWEAPVADRFRASVDRRLRELDGAEADLRHAASRLRAAARELARRPVAHR